MRETIMSAFKPVRGMRDFLPEEARIMRFIEKQARKTAELYGYKEIITPVVESYDLVAAKAGEEVRLRMYAFEDLGGRKSPFAQSSQLPWRDLWRQRCETSLNR